MARRPAPVRVRLHAPAVWDHMARQNLSQNDLARALEISSGYVSLLINGQRFPSPGLRRLLLQALPSATFDDLFIVERRDPNGDYVVVEHGDAKSTDAMAASAGLYPAEVSGR